MDRLTRCDCVVFDHRHFFDTMGYLSRLRGCQKVLDATCEMEIILLSRGAVISVLDWRETSLRDWDPR